jgi:hypothetical protein
VNDLDWVGISGGLVALAAAAEVIRRIVRALHRWGVRVDAFLGTPAAGEVPARPGVLERLDHVEDTVTQLVALQHQVLELQQQMTDITRLITDRRSA